MNLAETIRTTVVVHGFDWGLDLDLKSFLWTGFLTGLEGKILIWFKSNILDWILDFSNLWSEIKGRDRRWMLSVKWLMSHEMSRQSLQHGESRLQLPNQMTRPFTTRRWRRPRTTRRPPTASASRWQWPNEYSFVRTLRTYIRQIIRTDVRLGNCPLFVL